MRRALVNEPQIFEAIRQNLKGAGVLQLKMISEVFLWLAYDKNNTPRLVVKVSTHQLTSSGSDRYAFASKNAIACTD